MPSPEETFIVKNPLICGRKIKRKLNILEQDLNRVGWDILSVDVPNVVSNDPDDLCSWDDVVTDLIQFYMDVLKFFYCLPADHDYHGTLLEFATNLLIERYWDLQYECGGVLFNYVNHGAPGEDASGNLLRSLFELLVEYGSRTFFQKDSPIDTEQLGYDRTGYISAQLPINPYIWQYFDDDNLIIVIERQWEKLGLIYDDRSSELQEDFARDLSRYGHSRHDQDVEESSWYTQQFDEEIDEYCGSASKVKDFYFKVIDKLTTPSSTLHYSNIINILNDSPRCRCGYDGDRCIQSVLKHVSNELVLMIDSV